MCARKAEMVSRVVCDLWSIWCSKYICRLCRGCFIIVNCADRWRWRWIEERREFGFGLFGAVAASASAEDGVLWLREMCNYDLSNQKAFSKIQWHWPWPRDRLHCTEKCWHRLKGSAFWMSRAVALGFSCLFLILREDSGKDLSRAAEMPLLGILMDRIRFRT